jgi:hypothetical protein
MLASLGIYLHLFTIVERCEICYCNCYWKPKVACSKCKKSICAGCAGNIITNERLEYPCPYCRSENKITNLEVLNKEFFVNLWNRKILTFMKEDGEGQH